MDSESGEMFIRLNEQAHTRGMWGTACVTTCQKESRLGMMAAMNLCIKSWSEAMADHLGQSFSLRLQMYVSRACFSHSFPLL